MRTLPLVQKQSRPMPKKSGLFKNKKFHIQMIVFINPAVLTEALFYMNTSVLKDR